jgi:hypothetical protein
LERGEINRAATLFIAKLIRLGRSTHLVQSGKTLNIHHSQSMSWANDDGYFRWAHLWSDEGIARCIAIIAEKDRVYLETLLATTTAAKIKADVKEILEPLWSIQKKKAKPAPKPALKQLLPFTRPAPTASTAIAKAPPAPTRTPAKTSTRPCCIGCKKFQIHPNPPPHFTAEDMAHCCAFCRLTNGKRHGEHCARQKA